MLPLMANVQPVGAPQAPNVVSAHAQSMPFSVQTDAAAAARQQLPMAVSALGAPAAYHPDTLQSRQAKTENATQAQARGDAEASSELDESQQTQRANQMAKLPGWAQRFVAQPTLQRTAFSILFATQFFAQGIAGEDAEQYFSSAPANAPSAAPSAAQAAPALPSAARELVAVSYAHNGALRSAEKPLPKNPQQWVELRYPPVPRKPGLNQATGALAYSLVAQAMQAPVAAIDAA